MEFSLYICKYIYISALAAFGMKEYSQRTEEMLMFLIARLNIVCSNISLPPAVLKSVVAGQSSVTDLWGGTPLNRFDSWFIDSPRNDLS
jgi:hypothetical protein